ncbi:MAG: hydrogenase formation protein HypD [Dictyoglomus sp. NZ13-RE01]|nr:MAG: hydrogenase formation protein HypD [Dictyoglomus sp. NZ13-RE01]
MSKEVVEIVKALKKYSDRTINLMEFCGTHTHEIFRFGIRDLLPESINLLSGPGCPVCVTSEEDIDYIIALLKEGFGIITFGDLVNVPGSEGSLSYYKAIGKEVKVVYSPLDALKIAKENKNKNYVLIGIGFETTAPSLAFTVLKIREENLKNLYFLSLNKLTPPAMKAILDMGEVKIDGIIGPGHVSTIIGKKGWEKIYEEYKIPFVITGFEPMDILKGIYLLSEMVLKNKPKLVNEYKRSVSDEGNLTALNIMYRVFKIADASWRGLGILKNSGLELKEEYDDINIRKVFPIKVQVKHNPLCKCGEVLRGVLKPTQCPLYKKVCTPENPKGPCMVSSEGTCSAYYLYGRD